MNNIKKVSLFVSLVIALIVAGTAFCYAEDSKAAPSETDSTGYLVTADDEPLMLVEDKKDFTKAVKEIALDMVPENAKFKTFTVSEDIDFEKQGQGLLASAGASEGSEVASSKDEAVELLKEKMSGKDSPVTVSVKFSKYRVKTIPVKVRFRYTGKLYDFEFVQKEKGSKGKKKTRYEFTTVNGKVTSKAKKGTDIVKKVRHRVILTGRKNTPKNISSAKFHKYESKVLKTTKKKFGNVVLGANIVDYGKKFLGNPYRNGGKSLTHGIDCVQFVRVLYRKFGVRLPGGRHKLFKAGKVVSLKNARAGDVVFYGMHPAIYMGDGKIISARKKGISISSINYKKRTYIRRMR